MTAELAPNLMNTGNPDKTTALEEQERIRSKYRADAQINGNVFM